MSRTRCHCSLALRDARGLLTPALREALPDDAANIGEISVLAWQAAYRGIMPNDYLDCLSSEERAGRWVDTLREPPPRTRVLIAEEDGRALGFAAVGPCREDEARGGLYAINLRPDAWGRGTGTALLGAATTSLREA